MTGAAAEAETLAGSKMVMLFEIRAAKPADAVELSALACRAKAHWGYPEEWLRLWSADLTITSEYLATHRGFVAETAGVAVGVCVLECDGIAGSLEHVWIAPESQGGGIGRALVTRALEAASDAGALRVLVLSDPFAEAFYLRLGARRVGSVRAPMPGSPGRVLPKLEFTLDIAATG
jgi:predicted N-acetyltransferase YhbS